MNSALSPPLVSAVLLSYNRRTELDEGLRHLRQLEFSGLEVVVVDNASTDGTADWVRGHHPWVRLLEMPANLGVAAYNRGFEAARGEFVLILDDDSIPARGALERMVEVFRAHPEAGVVAFDVRSYRYYHEVAALLPEADREATPDYPMGFNGAGAGVRRELLLRVGGYPEEFFLYWNELDLSLRILQAGYRIVQYPGIVAFHKFAPTNRDSTRGPYYYCRNLFWIYWKYFPWRTLLAATARLVYQCLYSCLEQRTTVYLRAMGSAFGRAAAVGRKRMPLRADITGRVRIAWKLAFIQYR